LTDTVVGAEQEAVEPPPEPRHDQSNAPSAAEESEDANVPLEQAEAPLGAVEVGTPLPEPQVPLTSVGFGAEHAAVVPPPEPVQFQLKAPSLPVESVIDWVPFPQALAPVGTVVEDTPLPEPQIPFTGPVGAGVVLVHPPGAVRSLTA
jgi:hypothetical protein